MCIFHKPDESIQRIAVYCLQMIMDMTVQLHNNTDLVTNLLVSQISCCGTIYCRFNFKLNKSILVIKL